jgi:cytochrome c oxidase cbb3-type subunit III
MKNSANLLLAVLVVGGLFASCPGFSQSADVITAAAPNRPMYEKFGMTPTQLFSLMASFTAFLVLLLMILAGSLTNILEFRKNKFRDGAKTILLLAGSLIGSAAFGAGAETIPQPEYIVSFPDSAFWSFLVFDFILVAIIVYLARIMRKEISEYALPRKYNIFARWNKQLTDAIPVEEEDSILLDHDYDGIRELDNNLPPWWKYGFYVTIAWGVGYFAYYHAFGGELQEAEYLSEMEAGDRADAEYKAAHPELITADNVTLLTDPSALAQGRDVYVTYCQTCHMEQGKGGIGPNLTDPNWIYGGDIKGVFTTITNGAQNGMVAWKELLPADDIQAVASYILQLEYVGPPVGKAPQGALISE